MNFTIDQSIEILSRTPEVLRVMLTGLSPEWISADEGEGTWNPYDVIGHLIHGEKTDWMVRARLILSLEKEKTFVPFDRFAQFENSKGKSLNALLVEFSDLRQKNITELRRLVTDESQLLLTGIHPSFGKVTLHQLLSTWVVHDLDHIYQVSRVMAKQYNEDVGPWIEYLKILRQ